MEIFGKSNTNVILSKAPKLHLTASRREVTKNFQMILEDFLLRVSILLIRQTVSKRMFQILIYGSRDSLFTNLYNTKTEDLIYPRVFLI